MRPADEVDGSDRGASVGHGASDRHALVLEPADFRQIQEIAHSHAGLKLPAEKLAVIRFRLGARVRELGLSSFSDYLRRVRREPGELWRMIESFTNHNTSFYRESDQYPFLAAALAEPIRSQPEVRIWSAGCSTGEEPFTLGMLIRHWHPAAAERVRILATDLSRRALAAARAGRYTREQVSALPDPLREKFLTPAPQPDSFEVSPEIRRAVSLARLNLMDPWPMRSRLHVIFCRNVMIYFDRATQRRLAERFWDALEPGGYLFVGQTEALPMAGGRFTFLEPSVYQKLEDGP